MNQKRIISLGEGEVTRKIGGVIAPFKLWGNDVGEIVLSEDEVEISSLLPERSEVQLQFLFRKDIVGLDIDRTVKLIDEILHYVPTPDNLRNILVQLRVEVCIPESDSEEKIESQKIVEK